MNLTVQGADNWVPFEYDLVIITPSYNRPDLLSRLHSDLVGACRNIRWKHVVVDDASDLSYDLDQIFRGSCHFDYERRSCNLGALAARNYGLMRAESISSQFITFVDDDDRAIGDWKILLDMAKSNLGSVGWFFSLDDFANLGRKMTKPLKAGHFDYIEDFHVKPRFRQDATHVFHADLIRGVRFDETFRVNREWTFFMNVAVTDGRMQLLATVMVQRDYQLDGLTRKLSERGSSLAGLFDSVQKAAWLVRRKPGSWRLWSRLLRQCLLFLPKCARLVFTKGVRVIVGHDRVT